MNFKKIYILNQPMTNREKIIKNHEGKDGYYTVYCVTITNTEDLLQHDHGVFYYFDVNQTKWIRPALDKKMCFNCLMKYAPEEQLEKMEMYPYDETILPEYEYTSEDEWTIGVEVMFLHKDSNTWRNVKEMIQLE